MPKIYTIMFWFSITLTLMAVAALLIFGLRLGVDFKGGSVLEVEFQHNRPSIADIQKSLSGLSLSESSVNFTGDSGAIIRTSELSENDHQRVLSELRAVFAKEGVLEKRFDSVGPVLGAELRQKSITAIILVLALVCIYIAIVFRKMSRVLSPWSLGVAAIIALGHDVLIPMGVFALLGHFRGIDVSAVFVAAVLTILGYSVADTVVVFDRVRENIIRQRTNEEFGAVVHRSVLQTLTRSLNTTFTVLLSLFAIYFFGGESIKFFALALLIGIFLGAYSSIFVASPILVWWSRRKRGFQGRG